MVAAMVMYRIDDVAGDDSGLFPGALFAYSAASSAGAAALEVTPFEGVFVDEVGGDETKEPCEVAHSMTIDPLKMARFEKTSVAPQDRVEFGAIAVIAAVLLERSGLRIGDVQQIGSKTDYTLVGPDGTKAGVIEFAGTSGRYTSDVAEAKRRKVRAAKVSPGRIGVVAFGGPQLRVEVIL